MYHDIKSSKSNKSSRRRRRYDLHKFTVSLIRQTFLPTRATLVRFRHKRPLRPRNIWQISSGTDSWEISRIGEADFRTGFSRFLHVFYLIADSARVNDSSWSSTFSLTNSWSYHVSRQYRVQLIHLLYYTSHLSPFSFFFFSVFERLCIYLLSSGSQGRSFTCSAILEILQGRRIPRFPSRL